jgi:uncharacterized membrane protein (DUF4010 family)
VNWPAQAVALSAAVAAGLLIGIERGWKLREVPEGFRVAGVRTFTLLGLAAGVAGLLAQAGYALAGGALVLSAGTIIALGYLSSLRQQQPPDATSAVAAVTALALGFLAGAAVATLVLALRAEAHGLIDRLDGQDVKALARYSVIAAAVFPFLPSGPYGPYGAWNPQQLWLVVVLVTGFSFAAYVANRVVGARHGTIATAVIGGAYSSTAVTQALAQRLGAGTGGGAEPAGIALASAVMYLRVLVLVAILAGPVWPALAITILPATAAAWLVALALYRRAPRTDGPSPPGNPIALLPALGFVLFVALAAVAARWAEGRFGQEGIATLIFIMGSLDVDAAIVTVGGLQAGAIPPALAAIALGGTILLNMAVKLGVTLLYARRQGRAPAAALAASMAVLAITLALVWADL